MTVMRLSFEGGVQVDVELREASSRTLEGLLAALPFSSVAHRWGEEVYFEAPFHAELEEDSRQDFEVGDVGFWPDGDAIAVFFGRTPASTNERPRAYSPCNPLGRVLGSVSALSSVREGARVRASVL